MILVEQCRPVKSIAADKLTINKSYSYFSSNIHRTVQWFVLQHPYDPDGGEIDHKNSLGA